MSCPRCKSKNVECQPDPHVHRCLDCGYDGSRITVVTCDRCGAEKWGPMTPDVPNLCAACLSAPSQMETPTATTITVPDDAAVAFPVGTTIHLRETP